MRRRMFSPSWIPALALAGLLISQGVSQAEELAGAATAEAAVAADVGGPIVDGAVDGAVYAPPGIHAHNYACLPRDYLHPHLFYNYFVGGNCGSIPAAMYPSPMPTPPIVGHTFYTYQPLLPHEFMYAHKRVYHHHYNYNRGLHRTRVVWAW